MIPYGRQDVTEGDVEAVVAALRSDFLTQGPAVPRFEEAVSRRVGARRAIAVNSATSALHVACMAVDLGRGDLLWTVPNTFVASANCARYCGAEVDFVDIDHETWDMSVPLLREKLVAAKRGGRLPKVVVPVHFSGQPTDQESIWELAKEYGFRVIEDASHSLGATRQGEPVGSCRWSDITVFSFHAVKIITTGEGGMAVTNDEDLGTRMAMLRAHGVTRDPARFSAPPMRPAADGQRVPAAWHYEQQLLGYNYRMTDIQAALGLSQLARLDQYVERRNALAGRYDEALADLSLHLPTVRDGSHSAFHLYVVHWVEGNASTSRRHFFEELRRRGIGVNVHYTAVHLQPYYRGLGFAPGSFPSAERHADRAVTLPLFGAMTDAEQDAVVAAVREAL